MENFNESFKFTAFYIYTYIYFKYISYIFNSVISSFKKYLLLYNYNPNFFRENSCFFLLVSDYVRQNV